MKLYFVFLIYFVIYKCESTLKDRVIKDNNLSSENHEENDVHNIEYDHEAFLGKEDARRFEELTPEESKERLGLVFCCVIYIQYISSYRHILGRSKKAKFNLSYY